MRWIAMTAWVALVLWLCVMGGLAGGVLAPVAFVAGYGMVVTDRGWKALCR